MTNSSEVDDTVTPIRMQILRKFLTTETVLSGEELSQTFRVSRTAIWKHIRELELLGFQFTSVHSKGYQLTGKPNIVLKPLIDVFLLPNLSLGKELIWLPVTDSTNTFAQTLIQQGASHGTVVVAGEQTGGRGRRGRFWFSSPDGLWMSIIIRKPIPLVHAAELTLLTSVAVHRSICKLTGLPVQIKWPNDLLIRWKKICGILAEVRTEAETIVQAVIGIGINVNIRREDFPESVKDTATSLVAEGSAPLNKAQLVANILNELDRLIEGLVRGERPFSVIFPEWKNACATIGAKIRVQTGIEVLEGTAIDVNESGTLFLLLSSGEVRAISSGEVLLQTFSDGGQDEKD